MSAEQGDLNNDGSVTLLESYNYVYKAYQKYWNSLEFDKDWNFLPHISGSAVDIMIFDKEITIDNYIKNNGD
jgi:hypothetical protein